MHSLLAVSHQDMQSCESCLLTDDPTDDESLILAHMHCRPLQRGLLDVIR